MMNSASIEIFMLEIPVSIFRHKVPIYHFDRVYFYFIAFVSINSAISTLQHQLIYTGTFCLSLSTPFDSHSVEMLFHRITLGCDRLIQFWNQMIVGAFCSAKRNLSFLVDSQSKDVQYKRTHSRSDVYNLTSALGFSPSISFEISFVLFYIFHISPIYHRSNSNARFFCFYIDNSYASLFYRHYCPRVLCLHSIVCFGA